MDGLWAPKSPDLSFDNTDQDVPLHPLHPQHQGYRGSLSHSTPYAPYTPPASSPTLHIKHPVPPLNPLAPQSLFHQHQHPPPPPPYMPRGVPKEQSMQDADYLPDASVSIGKIAKLPDSTNGVGGSTLPPGAENILIKNHFPVARIKRIMQADDDVGKVAQVTPVVVSKALELFMISLVTKAAAEAKARNSKRVGALHLKHAITKNEQFDFLNDIVSKVADAPDKAEGDSMDVDGRKKKGATRRRKKTDNDDDDF